MGLFKSKFQQALEVTKYPTLCPFGGGRRRWFSHFAVFFGAQTIIRFHPDATSQAGDLPVLRSELATVTDVNAVLDKQQGWAALHKAAIKGHAEMIAVLLDHPQCDMVIGTLTPCVSLFHRSPFLFNRT